MTAFLSIILAFMNFLPIPALDGGYILFLLVEMITRRKPSDKFLEKANEIGFWLLIALLIFALVGIGHILDTQVIGTSSVLRTAIIFFYLSNEGISLIENAAHLGLPIPEKLKVVLEQLHDRAEKSDE